MAQNSTARVTQIQTAAEVSLHVVAKECMREAGWNVDKARKRLQARIAENETLLQEALDNAMSQALTMISSQQRTALCRPAPAGVDNIRALQRSMHRSYLESWLIGKKRLGDADPDDIRESIKKRERISATMERYNAFETAILRQLKPTTKRVRDVLDDDELRRIAMRHLQE